MSRVKSGNTMQILRQMHKDTPVYVPFMLIMKKDFTTNFAFYFFSYLFRFIGIFVLSGNSIIDPEKLHKNRYFSLWARYITSYQIVSAIGLNNHHYIVGSIIIFIIFAIQVALYLIKIIKYHDSDSKETIQTYLIQNILDHIFFLLYPFILEYLSFIYYIELLPKKFIIKKEATIINLIILLLNTVVIVGLNFQAYLHIISVNQSMSEENVPIKFRYPNKKFWAIFLMQNLIIIQCLCLYLEKKTLKVYKIFLLVLLTLIFIGLFFSSLNKFNYTNTINSFVELCGNFCFFSLVLNALMVFFNYDVTSDITLFFITLGGFIVSAYFQYVANILNINRLLNVAKVELFKINEEKINDIDIYDCFLYIQYLLKLLKFGIKDTNTQNLLNILFLHQQNCISMECKCKLLQLVPYGKNYDKNFVNNLIERISFLIESSFVQLDYSGDYHLSVLLSEHYFHSKNNPIMSFSIVQTILNNKQKKLGIKQQIILYELAEKYIDGCSKKIEDQLTSNFNADTTKIISMIQKEKVLIDSHMTLDRINKIRKKMLEYSSKYIEILKIKEGIEESIKIVKDEDSGEIKSIKSGYLKTKVLGNIIDILDSEAKIFKSLILHIEELKGRKLPYCIYYKSFLFVDLFMGGKMSEDLIPVMYSFTNDRNLYSTDVNPTVYIILRQRYLEKFAKENSNHTIIFKYTRGMRITYFSDPCASKLGFKQKELKGENIEVLLPKSIASCHSACVLRYLIINQSRNFNDIQNFMFDKRLQMIESHFEGVRVPGISKNLIIIINLVMREDTPYYYFLFDKNFELISLSTNFFNHFSLSLSLISKFNINLLKLFEMPKEYLKNKFSEEYESLKEYRYRLGIISEEYLIKRLFKDKNIEMKKFGLLEYLNKNFRVNGRSEDLMKERLNKVKKDLEDIYNGKVDKDIKLKSLNIVRKKNKILENIISNIDKFTDMDIQNHDYKKLLECRNKIKKYEQEDISQCLNIEYDIKVYIKMLYDQETYVVKIREGKNGKINLPEKSLGVILEKPSISKNNKIKKKGADEISKAPATLTNKSMQSFTGEKTKTNTSIMKREKIIKNISENKELQIFKFINVIIIGLLSIMLIIYIIILVYQNYMIETSHKIFLSLYYNYYQKDKYMNLLSSIISNAFDILNITENSIMKRSDYQDLIKENAKEFEESYHYYYVSYVELKSSLNEPLTSIYSVKNFSKIINTFENVFYNSSFLQEVENLAFLSQFSIYNEDAKVENTLKDYDNFFSGEFLKHPITRINSYSIKTLYYLTKNFNKVFYLYYEEMQDEAEMKFDEYSNESKKVYTILEILGFFIYSVFFITNIVYLQHQSYIIFRSIMNIFLDFTQDGPYSFKNHYDNLIIVKKINEYRAVLVDFNMTNLDKFNEKINKQNALEESLNNSNLDSPTKSIEPIEIDNNLAPVGNINAQKKSSRKTTTNDSKTVNSNLTKSSFVKLNNKNNSNNVIAKLNEKPNNSKVNSTKETENKTNQNLYSKTKDVEKEIIDEGLTTEVILNKTYNDGIIQIKLLNIALSGLYFIIIIYFFLKLFMSLNFCSDIKRIFNDFGSITSRSSIVYYYFNSLRVLLLVPQFGDVTIFNDMKNVVNSQTLQINEVIKYNMINYKHCQDAFNYFQKSKSEMEDYFIENGCGNSVKCIEVYNSTYNLYLNGLTTTLDAILLYTENLFNDYGKVSKKYNTNKEINKNLIDLDFVKIDLCLNYILNHIQQILYTSFKNDEFSIKDNYHLTISILNACAISYSGIIGILIMIFVIRLLKLLASNIQISGNRLNNAFCFIKEKYFRMNSKTEQTQINNSLA